MQLVNWLQQFPKLRCQREATTKLDLKTSSETGSDVIRASLAIFLNWVNNIFILFKCYGLKAEIELQESGGNWFVKTFVFKLMTKSSKISTYTYKLDQAKWHSKFFFYIDLLVYKHYSSKLRIHTNLQAKWHSKFFFYIDLLIYKHYSSKLYYNVF